MRSVLIPALVAIGIAVILAALLPGAARSHGDAEWIQKGPYKRSSGVSCCGVKDCRKLPQDAAMQDIRGRWIVEGRALPDDVPAYPSETPEFWICEEGGIPGGTPLCFFAPLHW